MSISAKNNDYTRPHKAGAAKKRRQLEHRRKLQALGVDEGDIRKMDASKVRTLLTNAKARKLYFDQKKSKKG